MSFAYELQINSAPFTADCDLSSYQYRAVKLSEDETIILASDTEDYMLGVLQNTPEAKGRSTLVAYTGISKAVAGDIIRAGKLIQLGTNGKFIEWDDTGAGMIIGMSMNSADADGSLFSLLIFM
jgi:hypothetical protein